MRTTENIYLSEISIQDAHLRINNKYFALGDSYLPVTKFICVSIAKTRIERIIIRREKSFDILQNIIINYYYQNMGDVSMKNAF